LSKRFKNIAKEGRSTAQLKLIHDKGGREVGSSTHKTALELVIYARSSNPLEASIGVATINSLIEVDESRCI
jgi:uncharacterized protein (DUF4213/DUF364 family)